MRERGKNRISPHKEIEVSEDSKMAESEANNDLTEEQHSKLVQYQVGVILQHHILRNLCNLFFSNVRKFHFQPGLCSAC